MQRTVKLNIEATEALERIRESMPIKPNYSEIASQAVIELSKVMKEKETENENR